MASANDKTTNPSLPNHHTEGLQQQDSDGKESSRNIPEIPDVHVHVVKYEAPPRSGEKRDTITDKKEHSTKQEIVNIPDEQVVQRRNIVVHYKDIVCTSNLNHSLQIILMNQAWEPGPIEENNKTYTKALFSINNSRSYSYDYCTDENKDTQTELFDTHSAGYSQIINMADIL